MLANPSALPRGTVTFLFTDIEGSTRMWDRDHAAMTNAMARHDAILSGVITAHGGYVFKTVGDAVCAAFPTAPAALAAALAAQLAIAAELWGALGPLRVRIAIHSGSVETRDGDYIGPPLNRVARLLAAGHGGQVLLSAATQHLVRGHLPAGSTLRDLGEHRLRDLLEPERIFQLCATDLDDTFPPLKSLDRQPTNLPVQPTPLIGRDQDLDEIEVLLSRDDVRLVTLTGMGGTGKTRLALQVAADQVEVFPDGAFFVDLAPITDPALVLPTMAATLGLREGGGQSLHDTLVAYCTDKQLLLLLDNLEQVLDAAPAIADLLSTCPALTLLVTSRAHLGLRAEHEYLVPPLATPDPDRLPPFADVAQIASVALFVERATAVRHDFALTAENAPAVATICARLDGLPLAIELAAARMKVLSPRAVLDRLTNRLALLTGGARDLPERQRNLRATIAWSYDLLPPDEQALFRRLAVFAGGFSLEAAETVVGPAAELDLDILDGVTVLVEHSLVRQVTVPDVEDGEPRFTLLETLREYGLERLADSGEEAATWQRHATFYLALAEEAEPALQGDPSQHAWLDRLERERDNLRAALTWASDNAPERAARLSATLWRLWSVAEAVTHLQRGLALLHAIPDDAERMQTELGLQMALGLTLMTTRGFAAPEVYAAFNRARDLCQAFGDVPQLGPALSGLWTFYLVRADLDEARALADHLVRLAEQTEDAGLRLQSLELSGVTAFFMGELDQARTRLEHVLSAYDPDRYAAHAYVYGHEPGTSALSYLSMTLCPLGFPDLALERSREGIELGTRINHPLSLARNLCEAAVLHQMRREPEVARVQARQGLDYSAEYGIVLWMAIGTAFLGWATAASGDPRAGVDLLRNGIAGYRATGARLGVPTVLTFLAEALDLDGRPAEAHAAIDEAIELAEMTKERHFLAEAQRLKGALLLTGDQADLGEQMLKAALDTATQQGARWFALRTVTDLARLWRARGDDASARNLLGGALKGWSEGSDTVDMRAAQELYEALSPPSA
jgi:predicted ATPase/class 3 adenylate cyclase